MNDDHNRDDPITPTEGQEKSDPTLQEERNCKTCKHREIDTLNEPCSKCLEFLFGYSLWESKDEEPS